MLTLNEWTSLQSALLRERAATTLVAGRYYARHTQNADTSPISGVCEIRGSPRTAKFGLAFVRRILPKR